MILNALEIPYSVPIGICKRIYQQLIACSGKIRRILLHQSLTVFIAWACFIARCKAYRDDGRQKWQKN
jgi:hypothetical protein